MRPRSGAAAAPARLPAAPKDARNRVIGLLNRLLDLVGMSGVIPGVAMIERTISIATNFSSVAAFLTSGDTNLTIFCSFCSKVSAPTSPDQREEIAPLMLPAFTVDMMVLVLRLFGMTTLVPLAL
eukprot:Blabericola_migrator_1__5376@NODE_2753_length_2391_cov_136_580465_g1723_i0_p3_GENE_NODE_2753_length_2391_cov_136_580465_g1723_i0NODE_2753_length_2391_cov_136_580465_g1723_i0_p3_ORF_typecomplete_len125_score18_98DUF3665/PF12427_8/0_023_NODE_2753_length_2391_cov_136_580465_g1723_i019162290